MLRSCISQPSACRQRIPLRVLSRPEKCHDEADSEVKLQHRYLFLLNDVLLGRYVNTCDQTDQSESNNGCW